MEQVPGWSASKKANCGWLSLSLILRNSDQQSAAVDCSLSLNRSRLEDSSAILSKEKTPCYDACVLTCNSLSLTKVFMYSNRCLENKLNTLTTAHQVCILSSQDMHGSLCTLSKLARKKKLSIIYNS